MKQLKAYPFKVIPTIIFIVVFNLIHLIDWLPASKVGKGVGFGTLLSFSLVIFLMLIILLSGKIRLILLKSKEHDKSGKWLAGLLLVISIIILATKVLFLMYRQ